MKYITYINIGSRLLFTIAIFVFVEDKNDFYMVPALSSLGAIIGGLYALYFIRTNFDIKFAFQKITTLKYYLNETHHIFISNVAISLYTTSAIFILGLFTNNTIVGYFAAADKIIQAFNALIGIISQSLYPYIVKRVQISEIEAIKFIKKIFYVMFFGGFVMSCMIYLFSDNLVLLILGSDYGESIEILRIISIVPFLIGLSNILGTQVMLTFNRKRQFLIIVIFGSIVSFVLSLILIPQYQHIGTAVTVVGTELFITIILAVYVFKNIFNIKKELIA